MRSSICNVKMRLEIAPEHEKEKGERQKKRATREVVGNVSNHDRQTPEVVVGMNVNPRGQGLFLPDQDTDDQVISCVGV